MSPETYPLLPYIIVRDQDESFKSTIQGDLDGLDGIHMH